jgi:formamidopyrimidine-DNA glycosylase
MLELPEAVNIAGQINQTLSGKWILATLANHSPHKFAWYSGDPAVYPAYLNGCILGRAQARGGHIEIPVGERTLLLSVALRYYAAGQKRPPNHQLSLEFDSQEALIGTVQMWGVMMCYPTGTDSGLPDYRQAQARPSPLDPAFDRAYFDSLFGEKTLKLSAKAFLATEQRVPGLGNGVLQDILWTARIHPRRKMANLTADEVEGMFKAIKSVLAGMSQFGGRDTERDLFGKPGAYPTVLSKNTAGHPCPACGSIIQKAAYLGGSIYFCPTCQPD